MCVVLPVWMRGAFQARVAGSATAAVRVDFLPTFERLALIRSAGELPASGAANDAPSASRPDSKPPSDSFEPELSAGRGRVRVLPAGPLGEAVLRPYRRGGLPGRFLERRYFLGARAFHELILTERLRWAGVPVAEPLAAVQERRTPGYQAALVTRRLPGARPLSSLLRSAGPAEASALLRRAARAVRRLHQAGGWHADLNTGNVLLPPGETEAAYLVDLDRGRLFPPPLPPLLGRRNLARLRRSLAKLGLETGLSAWPAFEEAYEAEERYEADAAAPASASWSS